MSSPRIAVIGAGLSGLTAAHKLHTQLPTSTVQIFEKSRSTSGRCATKTNFTTTHLDHGAPYFTLSPSVQAALPIAPHLLTLPQDAIQNSEREPLPHPRPLFYLQPGNARLADSVCPHASFTRATVNTVHSDGRLNLVVHGENVEQTVGPFDLVICTAPLPQTAKILCAPLDVARDWNERLVPTLTALLQYDLSAVPADSPLHAAASANPPYAIVGDVWTACETFKRPSMDGCAVIIAHADEEFSRKHVDAEEDVWLSFLRDRVEDLWRLPKNARKDAFAKRWRYARVVGKGVEAECEWMGDKVLIAGDGVGSDVNADGVERAIWSGVRVAEMAVGKLGG